ncbi:MAG: GNAT family N-acetyltransferase [Verrucomicrobiota bacterium]
MSVGDGIRLSEFEETQTEELVAMWRASFEHGVGILDPHPISEQRDYFLKRVLPENTVLVATSAESIVGFVAASPTSIAQLYVHVDHLRKGIGTRLVEWAKQNSGGSLWLYTFECNRVAQRFYERHGFVIVERGVEEMWKLRDLKYSWSAGG